MTAEERLSLSGFLAAGCVVLIWSSWLVVSRAGAQSPLTPFDMAALRYGISALVAIPFVLVLKPWRQQSWPRLIIISILLGPLYILMVFGGFTYAPAAHGGIFMNGLLPVMTMLIAGFWLGERPGRRQLGGAGLIIAAAAVLAWLASGLDIATSWRGDLLFVASALSFGGYMVVGRHWGVTAAQLLLASALINGIVYVPIWYFWLPSGMAETSLPQLLLQSAYQGLVPNMLGLLLVNFALSRIGATATSAMMAAVPGMGSLLGVIILGENLGTTGWIALAVLTCGIILTTISPKPHSPKPESRP